MAYNFMQMSHYTNTAFVSVMGDMDVNAISTTFQTFFPVLLLPIILMTLFDIYSKVLNLLRIKRFQFNDDFDHSLIKDGKQLLKEERSKLASPSTYEENHATELKANADARHSVNSPALRFIRNNNETVKLFCFFILHQMVY